MPKGSKIQSVDRILSILQELSNRPFTGIKKIELAEKFGVSVRTIERDLATLEALYFPIERYRSPEGVVIKLASKVADARINNIPDPVSALFQKVSSFQAQMLTSRTSPESKITGGEQLIAALKKYSLSYPKVCFMFEALPLTPPTQNVLDKLLKALHANREVKLLVSFEKRRKLHFQPYSLIYYPEEFFILGKARGKTKQLKVINLMNIQKVEILQTSFKYPENFDVYRILFKHFILEEGDICEQLEEAEVILKFSSRAASFVGTRLWHHTQSTEKLSSGELILKMKLPEDDWHLQRWILSFGPEVEVVSPPSLKRKIKTLLTRALKTYRDV